MKANRRSAAIFGSALLVATAFAQTKTNTFPDSGGVGIGTLAPAANLDVGGLEAAGALKSVLARQGEGNANGSGTFLGVRAWGTQNTSYGGKMFSIENTFYGYLNSSIEFYRGGGATGGFIAFTTDAGNERMRIAAGGNVGIGTTNPMAKLQIGITNLWDVNEGIELTRLGGPTSKVGLKLKSNSGGYYRGVLEFTPNGGATAEVLTFGNEATGNPGVGCVGIGTTNPTARLEVKNGNGDVLRLVGNTGNHFLDFSNIDDGTNRYSAIVQGAAANAPITFYNPKNGSALGISLRNMGGNWNCLHLYNNDSYGGIQSTNNLSLQPASGNVGIGTTNPTNKLEVNGTIRTKEVIVETTGWSDYVFASNYRLAPLSEVKAHIATAGHLPGIPSAAEVAEHGVSVGDMQAKLLAKMEEMTLHMIALSEKVDAQSAQLAAQSTRIAQLETENAALRQP
jgi:hypothetical protein